MPQTAQKRSNQEFLALARELAEKIGALAEATDKARDVPASTIESFREHGLLRLFQPARWGGYQADPRLFFDVQNVIAEKCGSTGWVYGVLCVQSFIVSLFDERAQADVWAEDGDALISSSFPPMGKAEEVDGGYRLSGRWSFSSGSTYGKWAVIGAKDKDAPGFGLRLFLVPRADYSIDNVWNSVGLVGTGSNDILIEGAFVPAYRSRILPVGLTNEPTRDDSVPELYRMPWLHLFSASVANLSVGIARGALKAFLKRAKTRVSPLTGKATREDPTILPIVAQLDADIEMTEAIFKRNFGILLDYIRRDQAIPMHEALQLRVQLTTATRRLAAGVDELVLKTGASGLGRDSPINRAWLDINAARVHPGNDPTMTYAMYGAMLMDRAT